MAVGLKMPKEEKLFDVRRAFHLIWQRSFSWSRTSYFSPGVYQIFISVFSVQWCVPFHWCSPRLSLSAVFKVLNRFEQIYPFGSVKYYSTKSLHIFALLYFNTFLSSFTQCEGFLLIFQIMWSNQTKMSCWFALFEIKHTVWLCRLHNLQKCDNSPSFYSTSNEIMCGGRGQLSFAQRRKKILVL